MVDERLSVFHRIPALEPVWRSPILLLCATKSRHPTVIVSSKGSRYARDRAYASANALHLC